MISTVLPTYARAPMSFVKGEGSWLIDDVGNRWLDAGSGIGVNILGHANARLAEVLKEQVDTLWHTSNLYRIHEQERLADLLVEKTFADTVFFTNSGAEACEAAVKMARRYWHVSDSPRRCEIITIRSSFHGRTIGMISAAGSAKLTEGFGPVLEGFKQVEPNNLQQVADEVSESTAAVMVEPVIGEGGIVPLTDAYLSGLRGICDQEGLLLIVDEVQCGMGRTGKLFAHEWAGIQPDIMAIAKGIGGGFPLGACLATENAAKGLTAGTHGSTYGGNPLACRVGRTVLEIVGEEDFLADVRKRSGLIRQRLESIVATNSDVFEEIRGSGFMLGLVCKVPNSKVIEAAYGENLLTVPAADNVIRVLPPLNMSIEDIGEVCDRIEKAAASIKENSSA